MPFMCADGMQGFEHANFFFFKKGTLENEVAFIKLRTIWALSSPSAQPPKGMATTLSSGNYFSLSFLFQQGFSV